VLDERMVGRAGVHGYDPLRLAVDVRGIAASGYELASLLREIDDINLELYGQHVIVAVFGMASVASRRPTGSSGRCARRLPASARIQAASVPRSPPRRPGASSR